MIFNQNKRQPANNAATPESVAFQNDGGTQQVDVATKLYYNDWIAETTDTWITLTNETGRGSGSFTLEAASTTTERTGSVTVTFDYGTNKTISVTQLKYEVVSFTALDGNMTERSGFTYTGTERYWEEQTINLSFSYDGTPFWIGVDKWQYREVGTSTWLDVPNSASETATLTGPAYDIDVRVLLIGS